MYANFPYLPTTLRHWLLCMFERQDVGAGSVEFLTDGQHEIQRIVGVDETRKLVYDFPTYIPFTLCSDLKYKFC